MTVYTYQVLVEDKQRNKSKQMTIMASNDSEALERAKYSTHSDMIITNVRIVGRNG